MDMFLTNNTETNNTYDKELWLPSFNPKLEIAFIMTLITMIGLLGNASIIFIILRHRKMRTTTNLLVTNLAVGDFLFFIFHPPLHLYYFFTLNFPFGSALCKVTVFAQYASEGVSVFSLTALSIERYQAIVRPMQFHTSGTPYRTIVITAVIWILSFIIAAPTLNLAFYEILFEEYACCQSLPHLETRTKVYKMVTFIALFALPMAIITLFYYLTALQLLRSVRAPKSGVHAQCGEAQRKSRMKLALVVLSLVAGFAVCWIPYYIYDLWFEFGFRIPVFLRPSMVNYAWWRFPLIYASSCINPLILYTISSTYRNYFCRHFCCFVKLLKNSSESASVVLPSGHTRLSDQTRAGSGLNEGSGAYAATTKL